MNIHKEVAADPQTAPAQPGLEVSAPSAFREKLFNLLAGRDSIEVLGQTASTLADIVARHPAEVLRGRAIQKKRSVCRLPNRKQSAPLE